MSTHAQTTHLPATQAPPPVTDLSSLEATIDVKDADSDRAAQETLKTAALSTAYKKGSKDILASVDQCRKEGKALADRWKKLVDEVKQRRHVVESALGAPASKAVQIAIDADEKKTGDTRKTLHETDEKIQGPTDIAVAKAYRASEKALALYTAFQFKSLLARATAVEAILKEATPKDDTVNDLARQFALLYLADDAIHAIRTPDGRPINLGTPPIAFPNLEDVSGYEKLLVKYFVASADADAAAAKAKLDSEQTKAAQTKQAAALKDRVAKRKDNLLAALLKLDTSSLGKCPPTATTSA